MKVKAVVIREMEKFYKSSAKHTRNSSEDQIANVNFYDDIVHGKYDNYAIT